jgi:hypothetical protein
MAWDIKGCAGMPLNDQLDDELDDELDDQLDSIGFNYYQFKLKPSKQQISNNAMY